jgi:hypothetical protein
MGVGVYDSVEARLTFEALQRAIPRVAAVIAVIGLAILSGSGALSLLIASLQGQEPAAAWNSLSVPQAPSRARFQTFFISGLSSSDHLDQNDVFVIPSRAV